MLYLGRLVAPLVGAGFIRLWRAPQLRFIAVAATLVVVYVLAWVPGKPYYSDGMAPAVLAAGTVAAERWAARGARLRLRRGVLVAHSVGLILHLPGLLPVPVGDVHDLPASSSAALWGTPSAGPSWPALSRLDTALVRGPAHPPRSSPVLREAATLDVLAADDHLPPVLSGHNAYWMWGPGTASDRTVLAVDALGQLRPYFASCRLLATHNPPYQVRNDWTGLQIGVCTGPVAGWRTLWPHLKHYG